MPQLSKQLISQRPGQATIEHLQAKTQEEEARMVIEKILDIKGRISDVNWNDFAILVRANSQAEIFCQTIASAEIPYQFLASSGLYSKPIILDILAYLKLLDNYHESPALYRILNLSVFEVDSRDIINLNYWARRKNWSLYETFKKSASLNISKQGVEKINKILSLIEKHTQIAREKSVGKVVLAFLEDTGYLKQLVSEEGRRGEGKRSSEEKNFRISRLSNSQTYQLPNFQAVSWLKQFFKEIEEFERVNSDKSIRAFQEEIEMAREAGETGALEREMEEGPESIKIMTIHGAKGLEFRYVFISNLVDRRFPIIGRKDPIELPDGLIKEIIPEGDIHLQEERRLFYVAMTRAKDGLFFTSAEDYGGQRKRRSSRFLQEIGITKSEKEKDSRPAKQLFESTRQIDFLAAKYKKASEPPNPQALKLPSRFSFTQLKAFQTCPLQYKFAHILHVPTKGRFTFSFGKSMHNTLYHFFQKMMERGGREQGDLFQNQKLNSSSLGEAGTKCQLSNISLENLLQIYESAWIDDWYESKAHQEEYKKKGEKILKEFYEKIKKDPPFPKYLELGFNFRLGEYSIKGVIDRVDMVKSKTEDQGKIEIIDYKTGRIKDEQSLSVEDKEQLLIYQLAGQKVLKEKVARLSFYYLDENKKVSFLGSDEELEAVKNKILKTIKEIKESNFPAQPNVHKCSFCDFKEICEYREQ